MFEGHDEAIQDILTARGLVGEASLLAAAAERRVTGKSLALILAELGYVERATLLPAVAEHLGCGWTAQLPDSLPAELTRVLGAERALALGAVPVATDAEAVTIAALDPFNPHLIDDLAFALGRTVRLTVADPTAVQSLLRRHYGETDTVGEVGPGRQNRPVPPVEADALSDTDLKALAGQPPIIQFVNLVLVQAIRDGASDIHFEPYADEFRIRSRVDGTLRDLPPPPRSLALPVTSRLKVLAGLNIAERRLPQDGRLRLTLSGRAVDLRVSTLPTQFGESVVLRVLDQSAVRLEIGQLGLPAPIRAAVEDVIRRPHGIFIVTGPTGSGKTTTLYSCLKALNTPDAKLLTVEDPVEYEIEGVMQVAVNPAAGLNFAQALRTFLRQDPDIVMVGEVRDAETARIAIQASLTGHLVLTTLHTNDAVSSVTRLVEMGIEPFLLASSVEAVVAQRLLRRICPECRTTYTPPEALRRQLDPDGAGLGGRQLYRGRGCAQCEQTGYRGRIGLFEFLRLSDALRDLIVQGASLVELRQRAVAEGLVPLRVAGIAAVLAGDTTVEEVVKFT